MEQNKNNQKLIVVLIVIIICLVLGGGYTIYTLLPNNTNTGTNNNENSNLSDENNELNTETNNNENSDNTDEKIKNIKETFQYVLDLYGGYLGNSSNVLVKLGLTANQYGNDLELGPVNENIVVDNLACYSTNIPTSEYKKQILQYVSEKLLKKFKYIVTTEEYVHIVMSGATGIGYEVVEVTKTNNNEYTANVNQINLDDSKTPIIYKFTTSEYNGKTVIDTFEYVE